MEPAEIAGPEDAPSATLESLKGGKRGGELFVRSHCCVFTSFWCCTISSILCLTTTSQLCCPITSLLRYTTDKHGLIFLVRGTDPAPSKVGIRLTLASHKNQ